MCARVWVMIFSCLLFMCGVTLIVIDLIYFNFDEIIPNRNLAKGGIAVIWVLFSLGVLGIVFGLIGFIGALYINKIAIGFYIFGMSIFVLALWTLGVLFFVLYAKLKSNFNCTDLGILKDAEEMHNLSVSLLCSSGCPCNA